MDAELACGRGHQLHQPHGAFRRVGARIEPRFHLHDGAYQRRPDAIQTGIFNDDVVVRLHPIGDNRIARRPDAFCFGTA
jgi:hypothetical protein